MSEVKPVAGVLTRVNPKNRSSLFTPRVVVARGYPPIARFATGRRGNRPTNTPERSTSGRQYIALHGVGVVEATFDLVALLAVAVVLQVEVRAAAISIVAILILLYGFDLYRSRATLSVLDDSPRLLGVIAVSAALGFAINFSTALTLQDVLIFILYFVAIFTGRSISYAVVHTARRRGLLRRRVAIVGTGVVADKLVAASVSHPECGLDVVGYIDDVENTDVTRPQLRPVIGAPRDVSTAIVRHDIDVVIVAFSGLPESELVEMIRTADRQSCEISIVERFFEMTSRRTGVDEINGVPLVLLQRRAHRTVEWKAKRLLDIVVSGIALILLSPLLVTIALISRLKDGPGVIFRQVRISTDGEPFEIMKFRSLRPESDLESATKWNVKNDDRMSSFGRFIRKTSIDELPQLINILRGDMSLVGPRPERPHFVEEFGSEYRHYGARHRVPSGLTGWAQIHGLRGDTSIEERARYDNYYIQHWSLWLDIKIMMRTVLKLTQAAG